MRILELLALLRAFVSSALVDALPSALDAVREAFQATIDCCVAFFTGDTPSLPTSSRRRRRQLQYKRRLHMHASRHSPCADATDVVDTENDHAESASPPRLEEMERPRHPVSPAPSLTLTELAYAHELVDRASQVDTIENDEDRGAHTQAVTRDIEHFLTRAQQQIPASGPAQAHYSKDDAVVLIEENTSIDLATDEQDAGVAPPSSTLSDWNDTIPREPGVARVLPPGWNTDWTVNTYAPLRPPSEGASSDAAPLSLEPPFVASAPETELPGSGFVSISDVVPRMLLDFEQMTDEVMKPDDALVDLVEKPSVEKADEVRLPQAQAPSLPPLSMASSTPSCRSTKLVTLRGLSYRQLTEELAPMVDDVASAFYRAALQKLKQEREHRARLRTESMDDDDDAPMSSTTAKPLHGLAVLRPMRVTPLMPHQSTSDNDDASRLARKKKLELLRQRSTSFAIKIGQPLSLQDVNAEEANPADGA